MLVAHDRFDLESLDDDGDDSEYGRHIFHFKRKIGVNAPWPSITEVCAMARCDCATCPYYHCNVVEVSESNRKRSRDGDNEDELRYS